MRDVAAFREAVRQHRRTAGRTQKQLARAIGLHPDVLSHKLNERGAVLTGPEAAAIVAALAGWGAIVSLADAHALLSLMAVPPDAIPAQARARLPATAPSAFAPPPTSGAGAVPAPSPALARPRPQPSEGRAGGRLTPAPLPAPLTQLVGRAAELAAVTAAVADSRLVTLTGTGGTGKTRLALQAAAGLSASFADGVAFADLAPVRDPELLAVTLARALGLTPQSAADAEDQLTGALRPARLLLVADNMEHLVEEAPLLARLLAAAPGLHLLVTSRISLGLYGESLLRVPPLRLPARAGDEGASEAVQLFVQRARAVVPDFSPRGEMLAATAAICAVLDGLPLAIELAAARMKLYPPQALLARLQARLSLLTGGPRDLPHRQQTLRAALDWSDALLPPAARDLFARLGVLAAGFDADAAAAVNGSDDPPDLMLDLLAGLGEHSLLELTADATPRFRMLETVREYALARLAESGETEAVRDRHLRYYLSLATRARPALDGPEQGAWLDRLEADFANIRAALDWARERAEAGRGFLEEGLRLATAVAPVWRRRASMAEGELHLQRLLAIDAGPAAAGPRTRAWAILEASALACLHGDYSGAAVLARDGLALCEAVGDAAGLAWAHRYLGEATMAVGDLDQAEPHFERQLELARDPGARAAALNMLGQVSRYRGRYGEATAQLAGALRSFRAAADPDGVATTLASLAEVARDAGQHGRALSLFRQALRGHQQTGSKRGLAADLEGVAAAIAALDHADRRAVVFLGAAQVLREANGGSMLPADQAITAGLLAPALAALTDREREQALALGRGQPLPVTIACALGPLSAPAPAPRPGPP